jgi:DNA-binding PadR family transcriptional regulator
MELKNPSVAMEIVSILYYGTMRAATLVKKTMERTGVSEPTVYSVLNELMDKGFVEKNKKSKRNVTYSLTKPGRSFLMKERFSAVDAMLNCVKSPERRRELLMELLLDDMLAELPVEQQTEAMKESLRRSMKFELEDVKKRLLRYTANVER